MGLRGSLTEITPNVFGQVVRGEEPGLSGGERRSIDTAWSDFHAVFGRRGPPLSLIITGDHRHPQSQHTIEDFCKGGHAWYLGFASPNLVREVAAALSDISLEQLRGWYDEVGAGGHDGGFYFFSELKSAYSGAAARGNALMIWVS